jgi:5-methyltetrahydrofolate--homocysteine methyltransferase
LDRCKTLMGFRARTSVIDLFDFLDRQSPILLDGAMGTQLSTHGLEMGGQNNLTHPDVVEHIHYQYAECGCHLLTTNTLTMNRIYIESHHLEVDVRKVNLAGVKLAKAAASEKQFVLGDISSTGKLLEPYGDFPEIRAFEAFKEQATILAEGGVDGFIIETVFDLREAQCAIRACREIAPLPIIASLSFSTPEKGGRTLMGDRADDCAREMAEAGANVVGANCGDLDPFQMSEVISFMREATALPLLAQPNAGKPKLIGNQTVFDMPPKEFVRGVYGCLMKGAQWIGGCCGTTPDHIRALAELIDS